MPEQTKRFNYRLSKATKEFNVGYSTIVEFLAKKGFQIDPLPNTKLTAEMYALLVKEFQVEKDIKNETKKLDDLYYKGDSVSIESTRNIETGTVINRGKEKLVIIPKQDRKKEKRAQKDVVRKRKQKYISKGEKEITPKKTSQSLNIEVPFFEIEFGQGIACITYKKRSYIYKDPNIRDFDTILEQIYSTVHEATKDSIKTFLIRVKIDVKTGTFIFADIDICKYVNKLRKSFFRKKVIPDKTLTQGKEMKKTKPVPEPAKEEEYKIQKETLISLSKLYFDTNVISLKIGSIEFILWEVGISRLLNSKKKNPVINVSTKILLNYSNHTFTFLDSSLLCNLKDLSIRLTREEESKQEREEERKQKKLQKQKEKEAREKEAKEKRQKKKQKAEIRQKKTEQIVLLKKELQTQSLAFNTMTLRVGNIRFFNGYYMIFQTANGEIDNSIVPYRVDDPNSIETLNLVHKFFEQILEQKRIIVKYDETKILEPSKLDLFQLGNYVRELKRNLDVKGVWWEEVQNDRKPSLAKCRKISSEIVKKKVSLKNGYLDNLASMQSEKKLISVYEVNHGKEEDAFIFTISMSNNRCAIVFENASNDASTTTWIFVTKIENYESCVNLVFDYFTDYTIITKRSTLRVKTVNPPEKFKAEDYTFIDHDDLGLWLKKLNRIIENDTQPSDIAFMPGLHIPESSDTRIGHGETISTRHLHNQLMSKLYDKLCSENGKDNVGTEIQVGTKRIDAVVKGNYFYDIYEIKTADNPFECVTEALGQLCQYTYLFCRDKIGKMVIVGPSEMTKEVKEYLSWFRKSYSLQLCYLKV